MIRCKLRCLEVKDRLDCVRVELKPVIAKSPSYPGGSEENAKFWAATPSGTLKVGTVRADHFEVGKDYYLDLTAVA